MTSSYPHMAQILVDRMAAAAAAAPEQAVAFQGAPGAYSHQAVREAFPDRLPLPCASFEDAIEAVQSGRAGVAMIPIENSLHGRVADIHFLLPESGLSIIGEHFVRVRHCLLGLGDKAALFKALGGFATNGVNMTKLESYLRDGKFSQAEFYAEIDGSPLEPPVARALEELAFFTNWVKIIGTYPRARDRAD